MSDITNYTDEQEIVDQKAIELAEDFSYDGYQVVRRELFAHLREPAVVIRRDSLIQPALPDWRMQFIYRYL